MVVILNILVLFAAVSTSLADKLPRQSGNAFTHPSPAVNIRSQAVHRPSFFSAPRPSLLNQQPSSHFSSPSQASFSAARPSFSSQQPSSHFSSPSQASFSAATPSFSSQQPSSHFSSPSQASFSAATPSFSSQQPSSHFSSPSQASFSAATPSFSSQQPSSHFSSPSQASFSAVRPSFSSQQSSSHFSSPSQASFSSQQPSSRFSSPSQASFSAATPFSSQQPSSQFSSPSQASFSAARPSYSAPQPSYSVPSHQTGGFAVTSAARPVVPIIRDDRVHPESGAYSFMLETGDGVKRQESGNPIYTQEGPVTAVSGSYSYTLPDGQIFELHYVADENGFQPQSPFLPVAPAFPHPIPAHAVEQIERGRREHEARARGELRQNPSQSYSVPSNALPATPSSPPRRPSNSYRSPQ
ncbi:hypothetical protein SK128_007061 [Halocaridina rubra]|uniref:Uncharacterized protein n=1 Tax=Halocaridina rubra TaxID=373956 RepID=A0AAN9AHK8_HALRR